MASSTHRFWTPRVFADVLRGRWAGKPPDLEIVMNGVSIDSRTIQGGQVFIAITGDHFDGHDFLDSAFAKGAAFAITSESHPIPRNPHSILRVPDTLAALQRLASAWRDELADRRTGVIAVAGSNGKTTTRHLIHHVLTHAGLRGTQSPKSFNNHIGVPLTLLAAGEADDFVVVEVGTNHPGEVATLGAMVRPDVAVITSIGEEHLEFFGDLAGVAREEASLLAYVREGGLAFVPRDAPWPEDFVFPLPVGATLSEFEADDIAAGSVSLPGEHNRSNAAAAAAVARALGVESEVIASGLRSAQALEGRSQVVELDGVTLINDSYNANPASMKAALAVLREYDRRRVAILGDMLELGEASDAGHRAIAELARQSADVVALIGERFGGETWSDALCDRLVAMIRPGDVVLLKASRGMRLERLIPALQMRPASAIQ